MKIIRYFFLFLTFTLASTSIHAMKRQRDVGIIKLKCGHLTESIEVSEEVVKHSALLRSLFTESPFSLLYSVEVADQRTLQAIVDCLKIIDAGQEIESSLLDYVYDLATKYTAQERINLFQAAKNLEIKELLNCFEAFPNYARKKVTDRVNQQLDIVIKKAEDVFVAIEDKKNSAIIIDVDDTALSRVKSLDKIEVNGSLTPVLYFPALTQVRDLYKRMVAIDFKIFFLTARVEKTSPDLTYCDSYEATVKNLQEEGYDVFEQVICVPYEARKQMREQAKDDDDLFVDLHAQWKEDERNKIAEKFTIAGTLDDVEENLQGKNVGHAVLIPRLF